ncbi:hypothetical protein TSTA_101830, partial [Talaromyces stipitatus ATCC 10500]
SSSHFNSKGQAIAIRKAMIDIRLDTAPSYIYIYWRNHARLERRAGRDVTHLEEMAENNNNIWKAAKYLKSRENIAFGKVPQLKRTDRTITTNYEKQIEELLAKFFPPLPDDIDDEGPRPQRAPIEMPTITIEEALGEDGLPAIVWKITWAVVKHRVLNLFSTSLEESTLPTTLGKKGSPTQWRHTAYSPQATLELGN